jgi:ribosomal-protein-alanine N-acetyltransferase
MLETPNPKHFFDEIPVLSSNRLILRGIKPADATANLDLSVYDGVCASNEAEALAILKKVKLNQKKGEGIQWGIQFKEKEDIIGMCSYHRGYLNNVGEIGYVLKPAFRGQGIMTEAVKLITGFGLKVMKLKSVVAYTDPDNLASINVLRRAGFQQVDTQNDDFMFAISLGSAL